MRTIWIVIIIALIVLIMSREKVGKAIVSLTRGYRNNNPGNIRLTFDSSGNKTMWKGEIPGKDEAFKVFKNMDYGYRAMFVTLNSYISKGYNTIEKIIGRWAPSNENNTGAYQHAVEISTGFPGNAVLSFSPEHMIPLAAAISKHENGIAPDLYEIKSGFNLFKTT